MVLTENTDGIKYWPMYVWIGKPAVTLTSWAKTTIPSVPQRKQVIEVA